MRRRIVWPVLAGMVAGAGTGLIALRTGSPSSLGLKIIAFIAGVVAGLTVEGLIRMAQRRRRRKDPPTVLIAKPKNLAEFHAELRALGLAEDELPQPTPGSIEEVCPRCGLEIMVGPRLQQARADFDLRGHLAITLCPHCAARELDEQEKKAGRRINVKITNLGNSGEEMPENQCPTCQRERNDVRPRGVPKVRECEDCAVGRTMAWLGGPDVVVAGPIPGLARGEAAIDTTCDRCGKDGLYLHPPAVAKLDQNPGLRKICYQCVAEMIPDNRAYDVDAALHRFMGWMSQELDQDPPDPPSGEER